MYEKLLVRETTCKTALNKTGIPGYHYCLNPYSGCSHGCRYCYADFILRFTNRTERWGRFIDVKVNFPEVLRKQLRGRKAPAGKVIMGSVTDPYQPLEGKFGIARSCLEVLADYSFLELNVLTKSDLILRDVDVIQRLKKYTVGFTITVLNDSAARFLEPGAAPPSSRLAAVKYLKAVGLPTWVFIAPLLPGVGDTEEALTKLLGELKNAGVEKVGIDTLSPYPTVVRRLQETYRYHFPRVASYLDWYLADPQSYLQRLSRTLEKCSEQFGYDLRLD